MVRTLNVSFVPQVPAPHVSTAAPEATDDGSHPAPEPENDAPDPARDTVDTDAVPAPAQAAQMPAADSLEELPAPPVESGGTVEALRSDSAAQSAKLQPLESPAVQSTPDSPEGGFTQLPVREAPPVSEEGDSGEHAAPAAANDGLGVLNGDAALATPMPSQRPAASAADSADGASDQADSAEACPLVASQPRTQAPEPPSKAGLEEHGVSAKPAAAESAVASSAALDGNASDCALSACEAYAAEVRPLFRAWVPAVPPGARSQVCGV